MSEKLNEFIKERGYLKGIFTRIEKYLDTSEQITKINLELKLKKLDETNQELERIQKQIYMLSEKDVEFELEERYMNIASKIKHALSEVDDWSSAHAQSNREQPKTFNNLPQLDIPTFSGDVSMYRAFIDLFTAIVHNDKSLEPIQKLFYLRRYLKNEALSIIEILPLCNESYNEALVVLDKRYNNPYIVISTHVNSILDLSPIAKSTASLLREFTSSLQQHLGALRNMKIPVDSWDMILIPLLSRKLDQFTSRAYFGDRVRGKLPTIQDLMEFLERRALSLEEASNVYTAHNTAPTNRAKCHSSANTHIATDIKQGVIAPSSPTFCPFCNSKEHRLYKCEKFLLLAATDRCKFVDKNKLCKICFNTHTKKCHFNFKCNTCASKEHNSILHISEDQTSSSLNSSHLSTESSLVMLPTVTVRVQTENGRSKQVRAILDSGSQTSFITADVARELALKTDDKYKNIVTLGQHSNPVTKCVYLKVCSLNSNYCRDVELSIVKQITTPLPQVKIDIQLLNIPNCIQLADKCFNIPGPISMLLSADVFFDALLPERQRVGLGKVVLQNTMFGYVVAGEVNLPSMPSVSFTSCNLNTVSDYSHAIHELLEKFWEVETITTPSNIKTAEQELCEASFQKSVQLIDNRFHVDLPVNLSMDSGCTELGDSFPKAVQRLNTLQKRFCTHPNLKVEYTKFIDDYVDSGHAEYYSCNNDTNISDFYFLPHHPVIREDRRTTKIRVVFDGSAKTSSGKSLNDILYNGPVVQKELFEVLISFRTYEFVFLTDIKKMFRQIMVSPEYRKLQCILWKKNPKIIQLKTVTYGLKSSSYLATRCLIELADRFEKEYPLAARVLRDNTYVDDLICGAATIPEAIFLRDQLIELLSKGSFELHKWCANNIEILRDIPLNDRYFDEIEFNKESVTMKALGITYDVHTDHFKFAVPEGIASESATKASVLACIGRFYDPLGLVSPILIVAKLFLQKIWQAQLSWNDKLGFELQKEWSQYCTALQEMLPICIKRKVCNINSKSSQLIGFCDATLNAYGCCIYLRYVNNDNSVQMNLVCAKSRVAPLKSKQTIPKLELCSAYLLAQLYAKVKDILPTVHEILFFSDSQVSLAWIKNPDQAGLGIFVYNRCKKILELTSADMWHHVAGCSNPADIVSRGTDPRTLHSCELWWHGPQFIRDQNFVPPIKSVMQTSVSVQLNAKNEICPDILPILKNTSSLTKMMYVIGYVYRFINNCKINKLNRSDTKNLTPKELQHSLNKIISIIQLLYFKEEIQSIRSKKDICSNLKHLSPFIDSNNVLRIAGRLQNSNLPYNQKHPIILPKNCKFTDLIILNEHLSLLHAGPKMTLASLSRHYWIINANREIKKIIHKCITCFKLKCEASKQLMGVLPKERVTESEIFQNVGIDFCGPFEIKQSRIRKSIITKGYVVVFVCFSTKGIHMELVSDMTTDCFLASLRRFVNRRGLPSNIFCDNGSTFKGANSKLQKIADLKKDEDKIVNITAQKGIKFNFIPSYSPIFGGLWEAGVKSAKFHFKRVIGKSLLTYEQFITVTAEVEGILNSRPLTPLSSDPTDFSFLTPGHFLAGRPLTMYSEPDCTTIPSNRLHFWRLCVQIKQNFWKVWQNQYLCQLQARPKWLKPVNNLAVGQLVILRQNNVPVLQWPMARIVKIFTGSDGLVRVVEVQTADKKIHKRSVTKVSLLPFDD